MLPNLLHMLIKNSPITVYGFVKLVRLFVKKRSNLTFSIKSNTLLFTSLFSNFIFYSVITAYLQGLKYVFKRY